MHHILFLDYVPDMLERRAPHRQAHLERIQAGKAAGSIVMAGALGQPPHGGAIVFKDAEPEEIERYAAEDPYTRAGLITGWRVEPWRLV